MLRPSFSPTLDSASTFRLPNRQLCSRRRAGIQTRHFVSACMAEASPRSALPRLRLLCLHSFRTSAAIFQDQVLGEQSNQGRIHV